MVNLNEAARIIAAVDARLSAEVERNLSDEKLLSSLLVLQVQEGKGWRVFDFSFSEATAEGEQNISEAEMDKLLYQSENLRKVESEE